MEKELGEGKKVKEISIFADRHKQAERLVRCTGSCRLETGAHKAWPVRRSPCEISAMQLLILTCRYFNSL